MKNNDPVNYPSHYTNGSIECIEAIEAALTPEEFRGYLKGCAMKYIWRERMKGGTESIDKARWYVQRLLGGASSGVKVPPCRGYGLNEYPDYNEGTLGANLSFGGTD